MALLPNAAFAGPGQPFFIDGALPVTITSGVINLTDTASSGSYISISPTFAQPGVPLPPSYTLTALPDNTFDISRVATPGASVPNALVMSVTPVLNTNLIDNAFFLNGVVQVTNNIESGGTISGLSGMKYLIEQLTSAANPVATVPYSRATLLLYGFPLAGAINVQLPATFFQLADTSYIGCTIFKLISLNAFTQTVDVLDATGAVILTVTTNTPCIVEAVRFLDTIVTYRTAIIASSVTNLALG